MEAPSQIEANGSPSPAGCSAKDERITAIWIVCAPSCYRSDSHTPHDQSTCEGMMKAMPSEMPGRLQRGGFQSLFSGECHSTGLDMFSLYTTSPARSLPAPSLSHQRANAEEKPVEPNLGTVFAKASDLAVKKLTGFEVCSRTRID